MSIFAVIAADNAEFTQAKVNEAYPGGENLLLQTGQWLVADPGTTQDVSNKLGITKGAPGALVLAISSYWGIKSPVVWEWMKAKMERAL